MQLKISEYDEIKIKIIVMLIRAGCVVLVSVVLALIPLYIGPFEYWNSRTSCIRNWSASVCCSGGVFVIYTARNPAFLFFPSQNSSNLARANNNAVDSINNSPLFIHHNYPLFIDVALEHRSGTFNNGAGLGHEKTVMKRPSVPWFNDEVKSAKKEKRRAERKWRRTKLHSDFIDFKAKKNIATCVMKRARTTYYTDLIQGSSDD